MKHVFPETPRDEVSPAQYSRIPFSHSTPIVFYHAGRHSTSTARHQSPTETRSKVYCAMDRDPFDRIGSFVKNRWMVYIPFANVESGADRSAGSS